MKSGRSLSFFSFTFAGILLFLSGTAGGAVPDPLAPADLSSPRATLTSFITHMNAWHEFLQQARMISRGTPGFFAHPQEAAE